MLWPGKLLAGNTIATCFKPAVLLLWELMRANTTLVQQARNLRADSSGSIGAGEDANCSLAATLIVRNLARGLWQELAHQELQGLPGLPQQSVQLLGEPALSKLLAVALGEHLLMTCTSTNCGS
jgi:hypothetical protein